MPELAREFWPVLLLLGAVAFIALVAWIKGRPVRGLYLAFFTSGILLTPHLPVVRDKLTATELIFLLTWFALLLHRGRNSNKAGPLRSEQKLSLMLGAAFILWTVLSFAVNNMAYTHSFVPSLVETGNLAYGYLIFLTTVMLARDWGTWQGSVNWWVAGSGVVVFFGVWATVGGAPAWTYEEFTHRVSSTLRNENQVPSYLLPILVVMVFMAVRKGASMWYQLAMWGLLAGALITSVGTGSRTALLMMLVSVAGVAFVAGHTAYKRAYRIGAIMNVSVAMSAALVVYVSVALSSYQGDYSLGTTPPWQRPVVMFYDWFSGAAQLDNTRPKQLVAVMENVEEHLLLGTGPKVYAGLYGMEEVHNTYAGVLLQTGMMGLLLFSLWLLHMVWHSFRQARRIADPWQKVMVLSLMVGMATLLLYNMTMFGLRQRTIWLLAGLLVASWSLAPRPARKRIAALQPAHAPQPGSYRRAGENFSEAKAAPNEHPA